MNKIRPRYAHIDLMETIAIFSVVLIHFTTFEYNILESSAIRTYVYYLFRPVLSASVPLFFFANGYLLFNREFHLKKHIFKTLRFTVLTLLWAGFSLVFMMVVRRDYFSLEGLLQAIFSFQQGWINYLWYMPALIVLYLFFPVLKPTFDHHKQALAYFTGIAFLFTFGNPLLNMISSLSEGQQTYYNFFTYFHPFAGIRGYSLVYFLLGGFCGCYEEAICRFLSKKLSHPRSLAAAILVLSWLLLGSYGILLSKRSASLYDPVWNGYDTIFTLINVLCIYYLSTFYKGALLLIRLISQNTLGIYLIHMLLLELVRFVPLPGSSLLIVNLVYVALVLAASLAVSLIVKKLPVLRFLI